MLVHVVPTVRQMNICDKCNTFPRQRDGAIQLELEIRTAVAARGLPPTVHVDLANTARFHFPSVRFFRDHDDLKVLHLVMMYAQFAVIWLQRFV